ncbi:MAG: MBL fold metallo-hydrolase [bacterium]
MIQTITVGMLSTNCYVLTDEEVQEGIIIDPGDEAYKIIDFLKGSPIKIKYIVNTHNHSDHIGANQALKSFTGAQVLAHEKDARMMGMMSEAPDKVLHDQDKIKFGTLVLTVLHTPGHTPGGICLLGDSFLFSGDTLFAGSVGRWDLQGGSEDILRKSIVEKLMPIKEDVHVYPGHGPSTTMLKEKRDNPYLK